LYEQQQEIIPQLIWAVDQYADLENGSLTDEGSTSYSFGFSFSIGRSRASRSVE
jgi:hypothetical protein